MWRIYSLSSYIIAVRKPDRIMERISLLPCPIFPVIRRGKTLAANPSYSVHKSQVDNPKRKVTLKADQKLFSGINYFWISLQMKLGASLLDKVSVDIVTVKVDGKSCPCTFRFIGKYSS